jgi:hypothetical protein
MLLPDLLLEERLENGDGVLPTSDSVSRCRKRIKRPASRGLRQAGRHTRAPIEGDGRIERIVEARRAR